MEEKKVLEDNNIVQDNLNIKDKKSSSTITTSIKKNIKKRKGTVVSVFKNSVIVVDSNKKGYKLYITGKKIGDNIEF